MDRCLPLGSTLLALLLAAAPAPADVTPEEVWESWTSLAARAETALSTDSSERVGDTLVIRGLSITYEADPAASAASEVEEIRFKDLGDGTVEVTLSDETTTTIKSPATSGIAPPEAETMTLSVLAPGARIIASGSPKALSYAYEIPALTTSVDVLSDPPTRGSALVTLSANNMVGTYLVEEAAETKTSGDFTIESAALAFVAVPDESGDDLDMTAALGDIRGTFGSTLPEPGATGDMAVDLAAGLAVAFEVSYGAYSFNIAVTESGAPANVSGGGETGRMRIAIDAESLVYEAGSTGLNMTISGAEIPLAEAGLTVAEAGFALTMPTMPTEAPVPYQLLARLVDVTLTDEVWRLFDPAAALPREAATAILEIDGLARLSVGLFSPGTMASDVPPGELHALTLKELLLRMAGADLSGAGAFTFDNADLESFDGLPAPSGSITFTITGANALMERLIGMGLMSDQDAMGFRMMLSMFANPTEAEDSFRSVLEFKDKGFFANGQRLQ